MAMHPVKAALAEWQERLQRAFATPDAEDDLGEELVWAAAAVSAFVEKADRARLKAWARDIKRWRVLPASERQRLVAMGMRYCALWSETVARQDAEAEPPGTKRAATA